MRVNDCFKKRLLRKIKPDKAKTLKSIEISADKLEKAKIAYEKELYDFCIISGYTSMFHAARALLYKDGIQEKSHYCTVLYIKENYSKEIPYHLIQSLDTFRKERHETLYGLDYKPNEKDARLIIKDAEQFYKTIKEMIK